MTTTFDLSILRENLPLDEKQSQSTVDVLASQHERLSQIHARITLLETELCELKSQRESILEARSYNQALIAPVRRIPAEIIGEIFKRCAGFSPGPPSRPKLRDPPLLLTRVCHRWRQIAYGTPDLWKYIPVYDLMKLPFFRMCLQNSGSVGLEISIELLFTTMMVLHYDQWPQIPQEIEIAQSIIDQHHRIRSLQIKAHHRIVKAILGTGGTRDLPLLQELSLIFPQFNKPVPEFLTMSETDHVEGTIHAPQLRTLTVDTIHGVGMSFLIDVIRPSSSLRNLDISGVFSGLSLFKFLLHCPSIEEIKGHDFGMRPPYPVSLDPVVLSNLRKLSVWWEGPLQDGAHCLLEWIRTPVLWELQVKYPEESQTILWEFISKARSSLIKLSFNSMDLSSNRFTQIMQSLTGIQYLSLNTCITPIGFWEVLTPEESTPQTHWILPTLHYLSKSSFDVKFNPEEPSPSFAEEYEAAFVRFLKRRAPPIGISEREQYRYLHQLNFFGYMFREDAFNTISMLREDRGVVITWLFGAHLPMR